MWLLASETLIHCRANIAHIRYPRPYYGIGFQVKGLETFDIVVASLGSGNPGQDQDSPILFISHNVLMNEF